MSLGTGSTNTLELPDPRKGKKRFTITLVSGSLKVNTKGPITSTSAILTAGTRANKLELSTKNKKLIAYIESASDEVTFIVSQN